MIVGSCTVNENAYIQNVIEYFTVCENFKITLYEYEFYLKKKWTTQKVCI